MRSFFFSPPPARAARGGEGSGVGGASANSLAEEFAEAPPTPNPSPPLRGGRGEKRQASGYDDHIGHSLVAAALVVLRRLDPDAAPLQRLAQQHLDFHVDAA